MKKIVALLKQKIVLVGILSCISLFLSAQSEPIPVITRPSAEAQTLEKFGEIPTDLYTGRVNIDIPLLDISEYDITIPIKINYFGGGIKVMEEDGPIGLGWNLSVGGAISRNICGLPDEMYDQTNKIVGYDKLNTPLFPYIPGTDDRKSFVELIKEREFNYNPADQYRSDGSYCKIGYMSSIYGEQYDQGHFDTAQDTYSFNFMGISGVFVIDENKDYIIQSDYNISIERSSNGDFSISDANGYVYRFTKREISTFQYTSIQPSTNRRESFRCPSAWWLTSITTPAKNVIEFYYRTLENIECTITDYPIIDSEFQKMHFNEDCNEVYEWIRKVSTIPFPTKISDKVLLSSIVTKNSLIRFEYEGDSCHSQLKKIIYIPNKLDENSIYKTINFYRSCFNTDDGSYRTKLDSLQIIGEDTSIIQTYKLAYTTDELFNKNIRERDHWGYWVPNGGLYPSHVNYFSKRYYYGESSRHSFPDGATIGMLQSITYPTGGKTELLWEPNTFSKLGLAAQQTDASDNSFFETLENYRDTIAHHLTLRGKKSNYILETSCNIGTPQSIYIDFTQYYPANILGDEDPASYNTCIEGWLSNDTIYNSTHLPYLEITFPDNNRQIIRINKNNFNRTIPIFVSQSGRYTFKLKNPGTEWSGHRPDLCGIFYDIFDGPDCTDCGKIDIKYFTLRTPIAADTYPTGGCRIKIIKNISGNDTIVRLYNYSEDGRDPTSPSSGVLTYMPRYGSIISKAYQPEQPLDFNGNSLCRLWCEAETSIISLSSHGIPTTLNGGSHIEYSKVTENIIRNGHLNALDPARADRHEIIYEYVTSADHLDCADIDETQYGPYVRADMLKLTSKRYKRGYLKRKTEHTDEKKVTEYSYDIQEKEKTSVITGSLFIVGDYTEQKFVSSKCPEYGKIHMYKDYGIVKYRVIPYNKHINEIKATGDIISNYQKYTYADKLYSTNIMANAPLSYSTIDSQGDTVTQYYTYTRKNKIHTCISIKQGRITDAYRNEYNDKSQLTAKYIAKLNPGNLPLASSYKLGNWQFITENQNPALYQLTNVLTESYQYDRDRLVQVTDETSGISTVYLWAYNGTHPVAEIRNATFANVVQSLGGDYMVNQLYNSYTPNMNVVNNLRNVLINSQVTTMTFKLLVGVTSITDPRGIKTSYEYDSFGNLKNIRDLNNRLLQTIQVHYIGEYL